MEGPGGLLDQIKSWQLDRWQRYYDLEPWGEDRADLRAGLAAAGICRSIGNENAEVSHFVGYIERMREQAEPIVPTSDVATAAYMEYLAARANAAFGEPQ